ncbi:MAG: hypothetical protein II980_04580 [Clostridia bacterium]|nr:hypothetical protein [Clostridia bacterium]
MKQKFKEWWSLAREKSPSRLVLIAILIINVVFFFVASAIISLISTHKGTGDLNFIESAYQTVMLVLDTGSIEGAISAVGYPGAIVTILCIIITIFGMIVFTGAIIGYVTNYISSYIDNASSGKHKLDISDHIVILNWNGRSAEIINDHLYSGKKEKIVVIVGENKEEVEREILERIADTINRENKQRKLLRLKKFKNKLTVVVREGSIFSSQTLLNVSIDKAKAIIIMENENELEERKESEKGNSLTIKALMQVIQITSSESSYDNQKIIVEVADEWTLGLVNEIIESKGGEDNDVIVPIKVNDVLGQILAQFSLMPELNKVYEEMFSSKGAEFYTIQGDDTDDITYIREYLSEHKHAIPLTSMEFRGKKQFFFASANDDDVERKSFMPRADFKVDINHSFDIGQKNIIILGHNSKTQEIMKGFSAFCSEWSTSDREIIRVMVIDDKRSLEKMDFYKQYPFVVKTVSATIYQRNKIFSAMEEFIDQGEEDTSILILSDDVATGDEIDSSALANLIYVQELIDKKSKEEGYKQDSIDVIVEIIDPKHHDIISAYNVNNIVLSNRYVSKMISQIGEVDALFEFYGDILTYDEDGKESKEIYIKKASSFFNVLPEESTAYELIRAVFEASVDPSLPPEKIDPAMLLGYIKPDHTFVLFSGDQADIKVKLEKDDKLIIFCAH